MPQATDPLTQRLHDTGLRSTRGARAVLHLFEQAPADWTPTHAELAARLAASGVAVNTVTLYRLLDRLVAVGLLGRHAAPQERAWRFHWQPDASEAAAGSPLPHFECDACHAQFPLPAADAPAQAVAEALRRNLATQGHQAAWVDMAVHGTCADCRSGGKTRH